VLLVETDIEEAPLWEAIRSGAVVERFGGAVSSAPDHFAWLNAIARRDAASALRMLQEQMAGGKDALELLGLIIWQLQRWLTLAHCRSAGTSQQDIETITGWKPWQIERVSEELKGWSTASLQRALEGCFRLDVQAKSGRLPTLTTALEQLVVSLCLPSPIASSGAR
jgi:DNA polymerase III delta subunit